MNERLRQAVRKRYEYRCGYCGVAETYAGGELTVDHYRPVSKGGNDSPDNLVYCCHACNEFKGPFWADSAHGRILHSERDDCAQHLAEGLDGVLRPLTPPGEFHIRRLRLNRAELIEHCLLRQYIENATRERAAIDERLSSLESRIVRLEDQIRETR